MNYLAYLILVQISTGAFLRLATPVGFYYHYLVLVHITSGFLYLGYGVTYLYKKHDLGKLFFLEPKDYLIILTVLFGFLTFLTGRIGNLGEILVTLHLVSAIGFVLATLVQYQTRNKKLIRHGIGLILAVGVLLGVNKIYNSKSISIENNETYFSPSPVKTETGHYLNTSAIDRSQRCGTSGCHPDIYAQWQQSAHRLSSFNNPFYKSSVDYLMDTADSTTIRWCAACHDPVMLLSGMMLEKPDVTVDEAHSGITCETCHGITAIQDITGNGNYVLDQPVEYPFSHSSGILQKINQMLIKIEPRAHRQKMLLPVHSESDFCMTCHKVSLDKPQNNYRWLRGQNEYDAWHHSGVSGNAVTSFYEPSRPLKCQNCHMGLEVSNDRGNDAGKVRGHYFNAVNTALPSLKEHLNPDWVKRTMDFMQDEKIAVDFYGVEIDGNFISPLQDKITLQPGTNVRIDVVVRTKGIGHKFPGGTIDSNEPWLQVFVQNKKGETIYGSGLLDGKKFVDQSAHFFRGILLDKQGEFILKRNPHEWVTTLYNNSIPPGSAEVIHYEWNVPDNLNDGLKIIANLNYRKFNRRITETFLDEPIDLPIVTMASDTVSIVAHLQKLDLKIEDAIRINDYGIGMLRQNNLEAARTAFTRVTEINPKYADGYVNLSRVHIKEGKFYLAEQALSFAEFIKPNFPKVAFFRGLIAKKLGNYPKAIQYFEQVRKTHPEDRMNINELGQTYYFNQEYDKALYIYYEGLQIDPEDAQAHYNMMLVNKKLGNNDKAREHQNYYLKYKPDEEALSISQSARLKYPHANNEAQKVHSHGLFQVDEFRSLK